MKNLVLLVIALVAFYFWQRSQDLPEPDNGEPASAIALAVDATPVGSVEDWRSANQVAGEGTVVRILDDDDDGSRHQRFILELDAGRTLLIAHNIDLAPRIAGLRVGDRIAFNGVYEWNDRGGVIHWAHHDPQGEHPGGWLRHNGRTYQ